MSTTELFKTDKTLALTATQALTVNHKRGYLTHYTFKAVATLSDSL